ncbi:MAG: Hpt domain-containing protein [Actinomycetota bacterium]|nr:Hpt domain-containing protein [Actinomycetota bacterium]
MNQGGSVFEESGVLLLAADAGFASALGFAGTFLSMLPGRVGRIQRALADCDCESALDAVLSLKISSSMAGAVEMEHLCLDLEAQLRGGTLPCGRLLHPHLCRLEKALKEQLIAWQQNGPGILGKSCA